MNCFRMPMTSKSDGVGGYEAGMKMSAVPVASVIVEVRELYETALMRMRRPSFGSLKSGKKVLLRSAQLSTSGSGSGRPVATVGRPVEDVMREVARAIDPARVGEPPRRARSGARPGAAELAVGVASD